MLDLINDLLDLSTIEAGKLNLNEGQIEVSECLGSALRIISSRAKDNEITILNQTPTDIPNLKVDPLRMKQVLVNLLSNSIKFTPAGGSVTIDANTMHDQSVFISISDTGIGMSEEEIQTAMTRFGQIDRSHTAPREGTGLGLPLSQKLIAAHDGSMEIASVKNQGTTVTINLPPERVCL